ncbi:MAG: extracellular solute-binding protein [Eubacteriales bacterium]|nr:extracellular solute-binding protein [Eubacteriales bacterium]
MKRNLLTKVTAFALSAAMSVTLLSGCGSKASDKDEPGRTVISIGAWPAKEGKSLDDANKQKATFEANNPDAVIQPDNWTFDIKTFYAKAAGGQLPTLFNTHFTEVSQIIDSGYSADLSPVLSKRGYDGVFNKDVLDIISKDGHIYAFPMAAYLLGLAYNTEMFEKAGLMEADGTPKQPKDWYEVAEFAQKIKAATGKAGIVFPTSTNNGGWIFTPVAWSFGAEFMKKDENGKWKATFNSPECAAALKYIKDLKWKYDVLPQNTLINSDEYYKLFSTGNAGMMITAGDVAKSVVSYGMAPDQLGIMAMPAGPKKHITLLGGGVYEVKAEATEAQIDACLRWLEMTYSFKLTDDYKTNLQNSLERNIEKGQLVGIKSMSPWSQDVETVKYSNEMIDKYANSNINHVKLYNDFVANCPAKIQPEEPVCAQELYGILDNCIQEVLTNKDADCATVLKKANADFQTNYLDNVDY